MSSDEDDFVATRRTRQGFFLVQHLPQIFRVPSVGVATSRPTPSPALGPSGAKSRRHSVVPIQLPFFTYQVPASNAGSRTGATASAGPARLSPAAGRTRFSPSSSSFNLVPHPRLLQAADPGLRPPQPLRPPPHPHGRLQLRQP